MKNDFCTHLQKEIEYWKNECDVLKRKLEVEMENAKSPGLSGLLNSEVGQALAPALASLVERAMNNPSGLAGTNAPADEKLKQITNYYAAQKPELKEALYKFFDHLAGSSEQEVLQRLTYFTNSSAQVVQHFGIVN